MPAVLIDRVSALRHVPIFRAFSEGELFELTQHAVVRRLHREDVLVFEEEAPSGVFVLTEGCVRIFREGSDGREQVLQIERAVAFLNESHLFDSRPHPACICASQDSTVLSLPLAELRQQVSRNPRALADAIQLMNDRWHAAVDLASALSLLSVDQRVAKFLLGEARRCRNRFCTGLRTELTLSNQQIGAVIGAVREVVSRSLAKLRKVGLIQCEGRIVSIPDEVLLERFIETGCVTRTRGRAVS